MALERQKAAVNNQNAISKERQQQTTAQSTQVNAAGVKRAKTKTNSQKTAQQQDAQPEAEKPLQGLTQMDAPKAPEAEDDNVRRVSNEFVLRWSPEALELVKGKPATFIKDVNSSAYARIYIAEAILCGAAVFPTVGRVPPVETFERWWVSFKVGNLWFALRYHDTHIREYELVPALGPTPGDAEPPPKMTRKQSGPPPSSIGPRPRRNRSDAQGSRTSAVGKKIKIAAEGAKKKADDAKRAIIELVQRQTSELEARSVSFITGITHLWRHTWTQINHAICDTRFSDGTSVQALRDVCRHFVQVQQQETLALVTSYKASFTRTDQCADETYGPSGQLTDSDAGNGIFRRLELKSWRWKNPPIAWNDDLFGVLWTNDLFGVREEERAYT